VKLFLTKLTEKTATYSNAQFDGPTKHSVGEDEIRAQEFYARSPYPDLGGWFKRPRSLAEHVMAYGRSLCLLTRQC